MEDIRTIALSSFLIAALSFGGAHGASAVSGGARPREGGTALLVATDVHTRIKRALEFAFVGALSQWTLLADKKNKELTTALGAFDVHFDTIATKIVELKGRGDLDDAAIIKFRTMILNRAQKALEGATKQDYFERGVLQYLFLRESFARFCLSFSVKSQTQSLLVEMGRMIINGMARELEEAKKKYTESIRTKELLRSHLERLVKYIAEYLSLYREIHKEEPAEIAHMAGDIEWVLRDHQAFLMTSAPKRFGRRS